MVSTVFAWLSGYASTCGSRCSCPASIYTGQILCGPISCPSPHQVWVWSGAGLGLEWCRFGSGVVQVWVWSGAGLGLEWCRFGSGVVQVWVWSGAGLGLEWCRFGSGVVNE